MPRIMNFVEERDFAPTPLVDDDTFVPTGAMKTIGGLYGSVGAPTDASTKFCPECGSKLSLVAKFCTECGANQD